MIEDRFDLAYDPETENRLLGAILLDPSHVWTVRQIVRVQDFHAPVNQNLYQAIIDTSDAGKLPDAVTVYDHLVATGKAHLVDIAYPHELVEKVYSAAQAPIYAEIVRKHGERRALVETAEQIRQIGVQGDDTRGDMIELAAAKIDELREGTRRVSSPIGDSFDALVEAMDTEAAYMPTPWPELNGVIGGLRPGAMYVIAGRPGDGKSVAALQLASHIAEGYGMAGFVSLEMSEIELLKRLISMMQGIHLGGLTNHALNDQGKAWLRASELKVKALPLHVLDKGQASWSDIVAFARALARKGGLKVLVVDYFGLISGGSDSRKRNEILEELSGKFKVLARDLGIAVVVLSQLTRPDHGRKSPRPMLTDLRGTGALEQDADAVILLHRVRKTVAGQDVLTREIELIVPKNRQGQPGKVTLTFQGEYSRITQQYQSSTPLVEQGEI